MARSYTHIKQYYEEMEQMHQEGHSCREIGEKFGFTKEQVKQKEGEAMLKFIKRSDTLILLDERGESFTSVQWAAFLEKQMIVNPGRDITFAIGGAYGFSGEIYKRADGMVSLSKMTFSHQIVRLLFIEQLYRAFTIIKGDPYHHE